MSESNLLWFLDVFFFKAWNTSHLINWESRVNLTEDYKHSNRIELSLHIREMMNVKRRRKDHSISLYCDDLHLPCAKSYDPQWIIGMREKNMMKNVTNNLCTMTSGSSNNLFRKKVFPILCSRSTWAKNSNFYDASYRGFAIKREFYIIIIIIISSVRRS